MLYALHTYPQLTYKQKAVPSIKSENGVFFYFGDGIDKFPFNSF